MRQVGGELLVGNSQARHLPVGFKGSVRIGLADGVKRVPHLTQLSQSLFHQQVRQVIGSHSGDVASCMRDTAFLSTPYGLHTRLKSSSDLRHSRTLSFVVFARIERSWHAQRHSLQALNGLSSSYSLHQRYIYIYIDFMHPQFKRYTHSSPSSSRPPSGVRRGVGPMAQCSSGVWFLHRTAFTKGTYRLHAHTIQAIYTQLTIFFSTTIRCKARRWTDGAVFKWRTVPSSYGLHQRYIYRLHAPTIQAIYTQLTIFFSTTIRCKAWHWIDGAVFKRCMVPSSYGLHQRYI
jgi:hypothetical protein